MKEVEPYGGWFLAERRKGGINIPRIVPIYISRKSSLSPSPLPQLFITILLFVYLTPQTLNSPTASDLITPGSQLIFTELSGVSLEHHRLPSSPSSSLPSQRSQGARHSTYTSTTLQTNTLHGLAATERRNIHWCTRPSRGHCWFPGRLQLLLSQMPILH